jgi:hypothetical protein
LQLLSPHTCRIANCLLAIALWALLVACPGDQPAESGTTHGEVRLCESDQGCDDGIDCTFDTCRGGVCVPLAGAYLLDRVKQWCWDMLRADLECVSAACLGFCSFDPATLTATLEEGAPQCSEEQFCDPLLGCRTGAVCAQDADCVDRDPCTTRERCNPATRTCEHERLDGDGDGIIPTVCGGADCNDDDTSIPGSGGDCRP